MPALRQPAASDRGPRDFSLKPGRPLALAAIGLLCLIWGTTWAAIQVGLEGLPPFGGAAIRFGLASVILLAMALARGVRLGRAPHERALWFANGLCSFTVAYGVVYWAEQWVPSGLAAVLFATYPFFVAILAHFLLPEESMVRAELVGILVGFAGVGVIFSEDFSALGGSQVAIGAAVMLLSPLASAFGSVIVKRWGGGIHPLSISAMPMGIAAGALAALALTFERDRSFVWDTPSIGALLYLAIFGSAVTFSLYYWLLQHLAAKRLALIAYVVPVIAVGVGALRGEPITPRTLIGSSLVVVGVALAVRTARRDSRAQRAAASLDSSS